MTDPAPAPHDATLRQIAAADPAASTWLSANAGSGKTRVLTDRVARLLLAGTPPQNVLCLTYTKAAAGEMQNRLFGRLGAWAMLPDDALRRALVDLGETPPGDLGRVRTLFARAIETPGGLKIQTIHSFCAGLLRQFPLEAGVSPRFTEMDDSGQTHLIGEILDDLALRDPDGVVSRLARHVSGDDVLAIVRGICGHRTAFDAPADIPSILTEYGADPSLSEASILASLDWDRALMTRLLTALRAGSTNDVKDAARLASVVDGPQGLADMAAVEGLFLFGAGAKAPFGSKAGKFPTQATRRTLADDLTELDALMDRVEAARTARVALAAARRTAALRAFAGHVLPAYDAGKARLGCLDFDDLIARATALLSEREAAQWVLWRLDGGIDHILVDESQDTSPNQWRVIDLLTAEFAAGEGARGTPRTLFVVGDRKQSIYSFQGADAEAFDRMRGHFDAKLRAAGGMRPLRLDYSFRSANAVLQTVDRVFAGAPETGVGGPPAHLPFDADRPGRVDLWPVVEPAASDDDGDWSDPVDSVSDSAASHRLSDAIAAEIARMVADPACRIAGRDGRRRVTPGDILILVHGRTGAADLFHALIRACKTHGLPVAGADVMRLTEELAYRDLIALLSFLSLPEDDLSLAAALRSPLFGWSEDALFRLAHARPGTLWQALKATGPAPTRAILDDLRRVSDFLRPFELLERILNRHRGRARLLARLGAEGEDGIDELLSLALAYERTEVPSLTGFLAWLDAEDAMVKRRLGEARGQIRVMTVHGAKGLEAPVVILPDTLRTDTAARDAIVEDADGHAHWRAAAADTPPSLAQTVADGTLRGSLERDRLLYVAMTRAADWLIVCGAGKPPAGRHWHADVADGLAAGNGAGQGAGTGAVPCDFPTGTGLRFETGDWSGPDAAAPGTDAPATEAAYPAPLPDWMDRPAPPPIAAPAVLSPSQLGGAKVMGGPAADPVGPGALLTEAEAMLRGARIHLLLEHLPGTAPDRRERIATDLLSQGDLATPAAEAAALAREAGALLDRPDLAHVFARDTLAEVDLTAHLPSLDARIHGAVDRLIVTPDRVTAIDFKTNAVVPDRARDTPDGLLRQMAAYREALALIFPGRTIAVEILWTRTGTLMPIPDALLVAGGPGDAKS